MREKWKKRLTGAGIKIHDACLSQVHGQNGNVHSLLLDNGEKIYTDIIFNQQGAIPNSELAIELGVEVNELGYIITNHEMRTTHPFVYAAGDVTRLHSHQVALAVAEGATAGETANYDLYRPEQKWE